MFVHTVVYEFDQRQVLKSLLFEYLFYFMSISLRLTLVLFLSI